MLMKTGILYFTTCFHSFGILRHVDPFVRMLHISEIWGDSNDAMLNVIPGYSHIYDIRESRNGGGVSIYVVETIRKDWILTL